MTIKTVNFASAKPGFTLLEMLVSVVIFAGIIIIALAAFARSESSSQRGTILQDKVQASRSVVNQITNDLHYVDNTDQVSSIASCSGTAGLTFTGVRLGSQAVGCDEIELLLKYPGATGNGDLVWRRYVVQTLNNRPSIYMYQLSNVSVCKDASGNNVIATGVSPCTPAIAPAQPADVVPAAYVVTDASGLSPVFGGLDSQTAASQNATPYITVNVTILPEVDKTLSCSALPAGTCYTLNTTIIPQSF